MKVSLDRDRVKTVFTAALEQPAARRQSVIDDACGGDVALRAEVESLLLAYAQAGTFMEKPASVPDGAGDPYLGRLLGAYLVEELIGRGGMGTVYLARRADHEFERRVAIKMVLPAMDSELVVQRFKHERQILATLDHPNIARLYDGGTTPDGLPYFVMEHIDGTPIDRYADEHRLSTAARVELFLGVLEAVQHAHEKQIVHRDLKPANVLVTRDGQPKLLDFGIAKILDPGAPGASTWTKLARPMTPDYASPEQLQGHEVTPASDVYTSGLLLYELLTGGRPHRFAGATPEERARVICVDDPEPPSDAVGGPESEMRDGSPEAVRQKLRGDLDHIILKALRKEPDQRYPTAAALAEDLRLHLRKQPVARDTGRYRARRFLRRHRTAAGVTALLAAAIAATAVVTTTMSSRSVRPAAVPAPALPRPSVAVVGFRNLSQRPADQWLSTAIAEMLATELASDGQLRVLPLSTVARAERDLGIVEGTGFSPEDIESLHAALGCDHLVVGTFAVADRPSHDTRIDIRDYHEGSPEPIVASALASEDQIFSAIVDGGRELRRAFGLKLSPPEATTGARAAFPTDLEATKLYAEGVARLQLLDAVAARGLLESAAAREPTNPLIQAALASAWTALGYDGHASDAAQKAFDASGGLNREDRLNVEGRLYETQRKWPEAIGVYRTLWGYFADNVEYGLRLAAAQTSSGRAEDALATVESMRRVAADPRIDLAEAQAAAGLGDFPRQLTVLQRMIPGVERSQSRLLLAQARLAEGGSYYNQGQPDPAEKSLEAARRTFIEVGDKAGAASALNSLANVLGDHQGLARVRGLYEEALAMSEQIGDRRGMSSALNNLGIVFKDRRRFAEALDAHRRALALRREIGDRNWTAVSLSNIGVVMFEEDRLREAATYYRDSLAISREIGDKRNQVRVLHNLAIVDRVLGNVAAARAGFEESLAIRAQMGDKRGLVMARVELATTLLEQAEIPSARQALEEAQRDAREARLKPGEAQVLFHLGETAIKAGELGEARRLHEQALALYEEIGATRNLIESQMALAELALAEDRPVDAEAQARRVVDVLGVDEVGSMRFVSALVIARARLARGDLDAAQTSLTELCALADKSERADVRTAAAMVSAEYDAARGHTARARQRLQSLRAWLGPAGLVLADLEARLLLWRIDRADRRPNARDDAAALERDARARNAGMIIRHLQSH